MTGHLSPTRAAILGQLTWGPHTAYELTVAMSQHVRYVWPRAHSHVYREVKTLARDGLARVESGSTGRRPRMVYTLSDTGRTALREWLASAPGGVALEHEPLLRVMFASAGTRDDLLSAVRHARVLAEDLLSMGRSHGRSYLAGTHERQSQVHLRAFNFDYLTRWAALSAEWAVRVEQEVRGWDDLQATDARCARALASIGQVLDELAGTAGGGVDENHGNGTDDRAGSAATSARVRASIPDVDPAAAEIASVVRAYREGFNCGDADALARLYSPDITFINLDGVVLCGRDEVREQQTGGFRGPLADVVIDLDLDGVDALGDAHAVARVRQSARRRVRHDERRTAPTVSIVTMVVDRTSGVWRIRQFQNTPVLAGG